MSRYSQNGIISNAIQVIFFLTPQHPRQFLLAYACDDKDDRDRDRDAGTVKLWGLGDRS